MHANASGVWLITGASSGFGRLLAERVARSGGRVAALSRNTAPLAELAAAYPGRLKSFAVDVRDPAAVDAGVSAAVEAFGAIDVLVNNAGRGLFAAVEEVSEEALLDVFDTNVFGMVRMLRATLPHLRRSARGRVIQVSSAVGHATMPCAGIYAATKHAVEALSESLAGELAGSGIRVCIVEPGYFATGFATSMSFATAMPEYEAARVEVMARWNAMAPADPSLVVERIVQLVEADEMPLRVPVGADAGPWMASSLRQRLDQIALAA